MRSQPLQLQYTYLPISQEVKAAKFGQLIEYYYYYYYYYLLLFTYLFRKHKYIQ